MEVKASLKYLNIAPRKTRLVAKLLKGMPVLKAEAQLKYIKKRASEPLLKLLKSAVSNAEHNFHLDKENLFIKLIRVDEGPSLKRFMPRARGAVDTIKKRTSHVFLTLDEIKPSSKNSQTVLEQTSSEEKMQKKTPKVKTEKKIKKDLELNEKPAMKQVLTKQRIFRRKAI